LDENVNNLLKDYDNYVASLTNGGTPWNEEQAAEAEQKKSSSRGPRPNFSRER
jgi:hypothetical protein